MIVQSWYGHYRNPVQNSDKVWACAVNDMGDGSGMFHVQFGRRGKNITQQSRAFPRLRAAIDHANKMVGEKQAEGYQYVDQFDLSYGFLDFGAIAGTTRVAAPPPQPVVLGARNKPSPPPPFPGNTPYPGSPAPVLQPAHKRVVTLVPCPYCGEDTDQDEEFCDACGAHLASMLLTKQKQKPAVVSTPPPVAVATPTPVPTGGALHGRYMVEKQVGKGGFGAVYKAVDTTFGRTVAVKEMLVVGLDPQEVREAMDMFKSEAMLLSSLRNTHLPTIYDYFSEGNKWYIVMEFVEGQTLDALVRKQKRLKPHEVWPIFGQVCDVLKYLHSQRPAIIFRDLKPENIMVDGEGHVYLIDLGIARRYKAGAKHDTTALGTDGYAAPEQYGKGQTTPRSDIYSLGATMHHLLSGDHPAHSPFVFASFDKKLGIPPELETLILDMVKVKQDERPLSIVDVKRRLDAGLTTAQLVGSMPPSRVQPAGKMPGTKKIKIKVVSPLVDAQPGSPEYKRYQRRLGMLLAATQNACYQRGIQDNDLEWIIEDENARSFASEFFDVDLVLWYIMPELLENAPVVKYLASAVHRRRHSQVRGTLPKQLLVMMDECAVYSKLPELSGLPTVPRSGIFLSAVNRGVQERLEIAANEISAMIEQVRV